MPKTSLKLHADMQNVLNDNQLFIYNFMMQTIYCYSNT